MMTVFGKGKAVIKGQLSFGETASPEPPPISGRWSFYTAWLFPSSTCAREVRGRHRLKSFGRDAVHNAGNWHVMVDACGCKGMVATAVKSAA